jgi:hypothetical protein
MIPTDSIVGARIIAVNQHPDTDDDGNDIDVLDSIDLSTGYRLLITGLDGPNVTASLYATRSRRRP